MPSTNPRVQWSAAEEIDRVIASGVRFGCVLADCHSARRVEPAPFMNSDNCRARGYEVDIIVTWEMTVTPAKRVASPILSRLRQDRKSTRLNSSHANISYAVFCLKKKKIQTKLR